MMDTVRIYQQSVWLHLHGVRCDDMEAFLAPAVCVQRAKMEYIFDRRKTGGNFHSMGQGRLSRKNECFGCKRFEEMP